MSLQPEIAKHLVSYLSPCDLGRVAQVNKSWRNVIYSNSCWNCNITKLWDVKHESRHEFYTGFDIPSSAHHMGEPTLMCFHDWLSLVKKNMYYTSVPFCILESDDFHMYVSYFHKLWKRLGRPCIHTTHYKWYDVFKGREFLFKMSQADQQRVFYRHCRFVLDRKVIDTNQYRFWLQSHIEYSLAYNYSFNYIIQSMQDVTPKSSHPADIIVAAIKNKEHKRIMYLQQCRDRVIQSFQTSIQKLRIYGKREFDKKDEAMWSELFPLPEKESI
jgi:hypothetical protein